jgi:hypothetical protein
MIGVDRFKTPMEKFSVGGFPFFAFCSIDTALSLKHFLFQLACQEDSIMREDMHLLCERAASLLSASPNSD